jgi:hypothetical protein
MEKKEKLIQIIQESSLPSEDKALWEKTIVESSPDFIENSIEILEHFPEELSWFNDIFKRKQAAFVLMGKNKAEAKTLLAKIYQEERNKLEKLLVNPE